MSASKFQNTVIRSAALLMGTLICGDTAVRAESPWAKIAATITGSQKPQQASPAAPAGTSNRAADVAEVQMEAGAQTPVMTMGPDGQLVAAAAPGAVSLTPPAPAGVTGLAVAGESKGQPTMDLGRESDETGGVMATELFKNPEILRLLGDSPRFTYTVGNLQDPMLVPWVRNAAIYNELTIMADAAVASGDMGSAVTALKRILALNDEKYSAEARLKLASLQQTATDEAALALAAAPAPEVIELPSWVMDNTTGVVVTPGSSIALVGDDMLKPGDMVPNYPEVTVASIESKRVVYKIKDKDFEVILKNEY